MKTRSELLSRGLTLAAAVSLVAVPLCWGGGGDNDSPYNLPSAARDGNNEPPPSVSTISCGPSHEAVVAVATTSAGDLERDSFNVLGARVVVEEAILQDLYAEATPTGLEDSDVAHVLVEIPAFAKAQGKTVQGSDHHDRVVLQGRFDLDTRYPVLLTPSGLPTKGLQGLLFIGPLTPKGTRLASVDHVVPIDVGNGIDLTELRDERLEAGHQVENLGAWVVVVSTAIDPENGAVKTSVEATAGFPIAAGAKFQVETKKL